MTPLEKRIAETPLQPPPAHWREEILGAVRPTAVQNPKSKCNAARRARTGLSIQNFFWPHPCAWGALAACWAIVAALNFSGPRGEALYAFTPPEHRNHSFSPEQYLAGLQLRNALLAVWLREPRTHFVMERKKL